MTKVCVVFAGGEPVSYHTFDEINSKLDEVIYISADKGYELAQTLGVISDFIVGDFDSTHKPDKSNVEVYPCEKDDTDLMLAIKKGFECNCSDFYIFGATGGRLDHMIGNIQALAYILDKGGQGKIVSDNELIRLLCAGEYEIKNKENFSLSLFAYSETVEGLTIKGAKYTTENATITNCFPIGVSNEIVGNIACIMLEKGTLLCIQSNLITNF